MSGLSDLIEPGAVIARLSVASKRQAVERVCDALAPSCRVDPRAAADAVMSRERLAGTGLGEGVAAPHARLPGVARPIAGFARLDPPHDFEALDGRPVDLMAVLLAPAEDSGEHLKALARISRLLRRAEVRERLREARGVDELVAILDGRLESHAA